MASAGAAIRFLCESHAIQTPIVTVHEQQWAYCLGGYVDAQDGHVWTAIMPASVNELKWKHVGFSERRMATANASVGDAVRA